MTTLELDKTYAAGVRTYGTIQIRVVVVKPKKKDEPAPSIDEQEPIEEGSSPLSSYLERSAHGKQCVVFIINGQRHDALDSNFIARELTFQFHRPVFVGDTVQCDVTITEWEPAQQYTRMSAQWMCRNQDGEEVMTGQTHGIIRRQPEEEENDRKS